jgi:hypothetical protein
LEGTFIFPPAIRISHRTLMPWEHVGGHDSTVLGEGPRAMPSSTV